MSYIKKQKFEGETVHLDTYGHWISFVQPVAFIPIMLACWYMLPQILGAGDPSDLGYIASYDLLGESSLTALAVIAGLSILLLLVAWVRYRASEYAITNHRATNKQGIVFRHTGEMSLDQIESVHVDQTIIGRILGFGTVTIVGTGDSREQLKMVPDPMAFRNMAMQQSRMNPA